MQVPTYYLVDFFLPKDGPDTQGIQGHQTLVGMRTQVVIFNLFTVVLAITVAIQLIYGQVSVTLGILPLGIALMLGTNLLLKFASLMLGPHVILLLAYPLAMVRLMATGGIHSPGAPVMLVFPVLCYLMGNRRIGHIATLVSVALITYLQTHDFGVFEAPWFVHSIVYSMIIVFVSTSSYFLVKENNQSVRLIKHLEQKTLSKKLLEQLCHEINNPLTVAIGSIDIAVMQGEIPEHQGERIKAPLLKLAVTLRKIGELSNDVNIGEVLEQFPSSVDLLQDIEKFQKKIKSPVLQGPVEPD